MSDQDNMSLVDHLAELRHRLILALLGVAVGVALGIWQSELLLEIIRKPILPYLGQGGLVFTGVMDKFLAHLKVGALGGVILTCPYWLYHVWCFISPGLYRHEKKFALGFIVSGTFLFLLGVAFVYFLVYPAAFEYLLKIGGDIDKPMITIDEYLGFFVITTLMFGLSFELPLVLVFLALLGIIDAEFLQKKRRLAVPALAVVCAIITPPDAVSMLMMLVPMVLLYEISILVIRFVLPKPRP
jgi:sec-independent protein translocase protein TatC